MINKTLCLLILIFISGLSQAQNKRYETIRYKPFYKFNKEIETKLKKDKGQWKYQFAAMYYDTKGDYKNALLQRDLERKRKKIKLNPQKIDSIKTRYRTTPAIDYIVKEAKKRRVVIINEQHHSNLHRLFTTALLKKLYKQGYRYLGLEALSNGPFMDSSLTQRKYPTAKTGLYTRSPIFGDMVRKAFKIGYQVFPYEQIKGKNGKPREIEQAQHIAKLIKANPKAKFLIHCGYDHALEGKVKRWEKAMAGRLTEYTGIDPLTISQTAYAERSKSAITHPIIRALNVSQSSILLNVKNQPVPYKRGTSYTDLVVVHPITQYQNNRPTWLFKGKNRRVKIQLNDLDIAFPVMVLAFKKGENIQKAIPIDLLEVSKQEQIKYLALPKGRYEVVVVNAQKEARKFRLKVR